MTPDQEPTQTLVDYEPASKAIPTASLSGYKLLLAVKSKMHSRLWELDVIVNRTLVYATLIGTLALIYLGSILLVQHFFHTFTHEESQIVLIGTTLAIISLFKPLKRHLQKVIDRRFYRQKYNASQTLDAFGATLREEVDLAQLSEQLVAIVKETMQPAHVTLWLRQSEPTFDSPRYTRHLRI
ncbi:MAG: hypothetical protein ACJ788_19420 [Ktedonobacteraceae bacterium]